jgi:hypothetical protein
MICIWDSCFSWVGLRILRKSTCNHLHDFKRCSRRKNLNHDPFLCDGWCFSGPWDFWQLWIVHYRIARETSSHTFDNQRIPWLHQQLSWQSLSEWVLLYLSHRSRPIWVVQLCNHIDSLLMTLIPLFHVHLIWIIHKKWNLPRVRTERGGLLEPLDKPAIQSKVSNTYNC